MPQPPPPNPQMIVRRTFEPTRLAPTILEQAYLRLVPETIQVINRQAEPAAQANAPTR